MKLYYAGYQPEASGFGWATCNRYLVRELAMLCEVATSPPNGLPLDGWPGVVFQPLADHAFRPVSPARGNINLAYTFFEGPLEPEAADNAAQYDVVFCGSTWCLERMKERGITNGRVLIQGVDFDIFKPCVDAADMRRDDSFRIFSGGKFEYRKGQDIVISAFKQLLQRHGNVKLVTAWHNPWPDLVWDGVGRARKNLELENTTLVHETQEGLLRIVMEHMQIPKWAYEMHGQLSQPELAAVMNSTDLGVFPNRCEGGTNLVLMEYMACGKPVVASGQTGHADICHLEGFHGLYDGDSYGAPWHEIEPERLARYIADVITFPKQREINPHAKQTISQFTWERAARQIVETVKELSNG